MNSALLIIDVQKFFLNEFTAHIPKKIANFIKLNRDQFKKVIFFKFANDVESNWVKLLGWNQMLEDSSWDLASELLEIESQEISFIKKASFSIFRVRDFCDLVKNNNISTLFLAGLDTHACIYVSAMEAFERGFKTFVIEDLCAASHGTTYHANAINFLKRNTGRSTVVNSKDVKLLLKEENDNHSA